MVGGLPKPAGACSQAGVAYGVDRGRDRGDLSAQPRLTLLPRRLCECVAASPVVADPGLVLASSAPAGPGPDAPGVGGVPLDQADQQPADLRQGVADHAGIAGTDPLFTAWARLPASQAKASMDKVMWAYQARQVRTW